MPLQALRIPESADGMRADAGVSELVGLSRSQVSKLIAAGNVLVDGKPLKKSDTLTTGTWLEVSWEEVDPHYVEPREAEDLEIVHLDDEFVVVNKPIWVAAHPSPAWEGATVLGVLAARGISVVTSGVMERAGIVQRLDAGTSGLMVVARTENAYSNLKDQFRQREVLKIYHALVQGQMDPVQGTIDAPLGRHPKNDFSFAVREGGRHAITHYKTLEAHRFASLLEITLETGRTHQIRVHFSALKHPLVGDSMYGADPKLAERLGLERQWLHAVKLGFKHPATGENVEFSSDYPSDLAGALEALRVS